MKRRGRVVLTVAILIILVLAVAVAYEEMTVVCIGDAGLPLWIRRHVGGC